MHAVPAHDVRALARTRLTARILGATVAALVLFILIGESLVAKQRNGTPPTPLAAVGMGTVALYAVGLIVALLWELPGAVLSAVAVGTADVMILLGAFPDAPGGRAMFLNPFMLALWIPIGVYLGSWWMHRHPVTGAAPTSTGDQTSR